jgi:hypothetical protein
MLRHDLRASVLVRSTETIRVQYEIFGTVSDVRADN